MKTRSRKAKERAARIERNHARNASLGRIKRQVVKGYTADDEIFVIYAISQDTMRRNADYCLV